MGVRDTGDHGCLSRELSIQLGDGDGHNRQTDRQTDTHTHTHTRAYYIPPHTHTPHTHIHTPTHTTHIHTHSTLHTTTYTPHTHTHTHTTKLGVCLTFSCSLQHSRKEKLEKNLNLRKRGRKSSLKIMAVSTRLSEKVENSCGGGRRWEGYGGGSLSCSRVAKA
jgi:hypothetical protein